MALALPRRAQANAPRDRAVAFLEQLLAAGPRTSQEIWAAAQQIGLSDCTLQRARKGLTMRCRRVVRESRAAHDWLLHGQVLPEEPSDMPEIDRAIAELEKQFPPPTPLDEEDDEPHE